MGVYRVSDRNRAWPTKRPERGSQLFSHFDAVQAKQGFVVVLGSARKVLPVAAFL